MQRSRNRYDRSFSDVISAVFDDDHRSVFEITHALTALLSLLENGKRYFFAGNGYGLYGVGKLVEIQDFDFLDRSDFVEIEIDGNYDALELNRKLKELSVYIGSIGEFAVVDNYVRPEMFLKLVDYIFHDCVSEGLRCRQRTGAAKPRTPV